MRERGTGIQQPYTTSFWQRRARIRFELVDVAIVGAGICGLSIAWWLRRAQPGWRILVLERRHIAHGASGRNAGFLLQGLATAYAEDVATHGAESARTLWEFTLENRNLLLASFGAERLRAVESGSLTVAGTEAEAGRLSRSQELLSRDGVVSDFLSASATNARLKSRDFFGALEVPTGVVVDPVSTAKAIGADAEILEGVAVEDISPLGGRCLIEGDRCVVEASRVVVAVNASTSLVLPELAGIVRPTRAQMFVTDALPRVLTQPVYTHEGYYYIRQTDEGEVLVGGARHKHFRTEVGFEDATTTAVQSDLADYLTRHFPWARDYRVRRRWSGCMGFTERRMPIVEDLPARGPLTWVGGFSGHGMSTAFALGRAVAEHVAGREAPILSLFRR